MTFPCEPFIPSEIVWSQERGRLESSALGLTTTGLAGPTEPACRAGPRLQTVSRSSAPDSPVLMPVLRPWAPTGVSVPVRVEGGAGSVYTTETVLTPQGCCELHLNLVNVVTR